jgi:hypothetical protein
MGNGLLRGAAGYELFGRRGDDQHATKAAVHGPEEIRVQSGPPGVRGTLPVGSCAGLVSGPQGLLVMVLGYDANAT